MTDALRMEPSVEVRTEQLRQKFNKDGGLVWYNSVQTTIEDAFRDGAKAERGRIMKLLRAPTQHLEDVMCQTLDTVKEPIVRRNKSLDGPQWEVVDPEDALVVRAVFMTAELAHKEATRLFDMTWSMAVLAAVAAAIEADPT